jgi:hypothetical protein
MGTVSGVGASNINDLSQGLETLTSNDVESMLANYDLDPAKLNNLTTDQLARLKEKLGPLADTFREKGLDLNNLSQSNVKDFLSVAIKTQDKSMSETIKKTIDSFQTNANEGEDGQHPDATDQVV